MKKLKSEIIDTAPICAESKTWLKEKLLPELGYEVEEKRVPKAGEVWLDYRGNPTYIVKHSEALAFDIDRCVPAGVFHWIDFEGFPPKKYLAPDLETYFKKKFEGEL